MTRRYLTAILFIPLLAVFVAMSIGKSEDYRLSKRTALLYIPTTVLFLLVITNDLHQLVFTFPKDAAVWTDDEYGYTIVYYFLILWLFVCALTMFTVMYKRRRVSGRRRLILLPCIPLVILLGYLILYFLRVKWLLLIAGDMTAVKCLMYAATIEICIQCGFIQANTHYMELFDALTGGTQITVMLKDGIRLSGAPIQGGYVIWSKDMSPLLAVLDDLREAKENLEDSNGLLEEENAVRAREARIAQQDCLYNIIQRDTSRQIHLLDELFGQVEKAETDKERERLLQKMLVIAAMRECMTNAVRPGLN